MNGKWEGALFCAALQARDTKRIASVGTIMQLLDTDDRSIIDAKTWPGNKVTLNRVVTKCRAVGVAEILSIEECDYGEDDYLVANIRIQNEKETLSVSMKSNSDHFHHIVQQIIGDYCQSSPGMRCNHYPHSITTLFTMKGNSGSW
jgi:hypothetical protein